MQNIVDEWELTHLVVHWKINVCMHMMTKYWHRTCKKVYSVVGNRHYKHEIFQRHDSVCFPSLAQIHVCLNACTMWCTYNPCTYVEGCSNGRVLFVVVWYTQCTGCACTCILLSSVCGCVFNLKDIFYTPVCWWWYITQHSHYWSGLYLGAHGSIHVYESQVNIHVYMYMCFNLYPYVHLQLQFISLSVTNILCDFLSWSPSCPPHWNT